MVGREERVRAREEEECDDTHGPEITPFVIGTSKDLRANKVGRSFCLMEASSIVLIRLIKVRKAKIDELDKLFIFHEHYVFCF